MRNAVALKVDMFICHQLGGRIHTSEQCRPHWKSPDFGSRWQWWPPPRVPSSSRRGYLRKFVTVEMKWQAISHKTTVSYKGQSWTGEQEQHRAFMIPLFTWSEFRSGIIERPKFQLRIRIHWTLQSFPSHRLLYYVMFCFGSSPALQ